MSANFDLPPMPEPLKPRNCIIESREPLSPYTGTKPSGDKFLINWSLRGNPLFFVNFDGLTMIVDELLSNPKFYYEMKVATDCELYKICGGDEKLMSAIILYFHDYINDKKNGNLNVDREELLTDLDKYANIPHERSSEIICGNNVH
jgi:hypothetical protein